MSLAIATQFLPAMATTHPPLYSKMLCHWQRQEGRVGKGADAEMNRSDTYAQTGKGENVGPGNQDPLDTQRQLRA